MKASTPVILAVVFGLVASLASAEASAQPNTLNVEGVMTSTGGGASADGTYTLTFSLYDVASGGKALWTEGGQVAVIKGRFRTILGKSAALPASLGTKKNLWLGVKVDQDPELLRQPVHSVMFALHAKTATNAATATKATTADTATTAKSADTAKSAQSLSCTACVSTKALKFDGDVDLSGYNLVAGKLTAKTIVAAEIVGDGSKLTGLPGAKLLGAACPNGQVVSGIKADGTLSCSKGAAELPKDGLDDISNGLLTNQFIYTTKAAKSVPITDNNPQGVTSTIVVPDYGLAQTLTIAVDVSNSDTSKFKLILTDPAKKQHILWENGAKTPVIQAQWPPTKLKSGDIGSWIGKNPKGTWTLTAVDASYKDNKIDGAIKSWSVAVQVVSNSLVEAKKDLTVAGHLKAAGTFQFPVAENAPSKCDAAHVGYAYVNPKTKQLFVCNGDEFGKVAIVPKLGEQQNPAKSCLDLLTKRPELAKADGNYWIKPGTKAVQAWCDMTTDGGGYTMYAVDAGTNTCKQSDGNSCKDLGMRIVYPRSKAMWSSMLKKFGNSYFSTIPGVYKASNGGNYTNCPMRSSHYGSHCGGWRVADGGKWWLRDGNYSEPNGDYTANCWLSMYKFDVNDIQFNDGNCSYCTKKYICSTNDKK